MHLGAQSFWRPLASSFLEPNRFATIYDHEASRLILEAGYGATVLHTESVDFGAEALIWSGLKTLTGFRFPVETADYFFGINAIIPSLNTTPFLTARIRLAHISSHRVDGTKDSVIGGSSSKFSREFISLEAQYHSIFDELPFRGMLGVKYIFHQVTRVESDVQLIAAVEYPFVQWSSSSDHSTFFGGEIFASASTGTGPQDQNARFALTLRTLTDARHTIDLFAAYHLGATIYGIEGDRTRNGFEIGMMFSTVSF
jgi:hypothetical protein